MTNINNSYQDSHYHSHNRHYEPVKHSHKSSSRKLEAKLEEKLEEGIDLMGSSTIKLKRTLDRLNKKEAKLILSKKLEYCNPYISNYYRYDHFLHIDPKLTFARTPQQRLIQVIDFWADVEDNKVPYPFNSFVAARSTMPISEFTLDQHNQNRLNRVTDYSELVRQITKKNKHGIKHTKQNLVHLSVDQLQSILTNPSLFFDQLLVARKKLTPLRQTNYLLAIKNKIDQFIRQFPNGRTKLQLRKLNQFLLFRLGKVDTPYFSQKSNYVIGDIHGDLHQLLGPLIDIGAIRFKPNEPRYLGYCFGMSQDTPYSEVTCNISELARLDSSDRAAYRIIPNIEPHPSFKGHVYLVGDILDRGDLDQSCLGVIRSIMRQQSDNPILSLSLGDHDVYGVLEDRSDISFYPTNQRYYEKNAIVYTKDDVIDDDYYMDLFHELRHAYQDPSFNIFNIDNEGTLYSHTYLKQSFLNNVSLFLEDYLLEELPEFNDHCHYFSQFIDGFPKDDVPDDYLDHLKGMTAIINSIFKRYPVEFYYKVLIKGDSIIWARGKHDTIRIPQCIGHNSIATSNSAVFATDDKVYDKAKLEKKDLSTPILLCDLGGFFGSEREGLSSRPAYVTKQEGVITTHSMGGPLHLGGYLEELL
ncbi:hypothetical protein DID75_05465 [Candidatus Marinamargulisbacteria bacterium SCGC AG-410-N11]|nr:hypothetical protein DID75_05465 [Candidatus Marinamargulisbacteria bacterium SCGC AG-410-N11]